MDTRTVTSAPTELLQPLLTGLPVDERVDILRRIERAAADQLRRKQDPPRRRRRGEDGRLGWPEEAHS
jgi:hypothetical protein